MKDLSKMLEIKCDCSETVDWHELKEFQGGLKSRDDSDYEKMKTSLLKYGWSFVMYYWNDGKTKWILDGHNRKKVLQKLEEEGYFIPPLPAIEVYAKDKSEAKQKLLRLNSQYGKMTKESVLEFAEDIDLNFDEIALPDTTIDFAEEEIPENLDEDLQSLEKKDFKVSLVFKSEEQIKDFIEMYEQELKEKYNCYVSVAGGAYEINKSHN